MAAGEYDMTIEAGTDWEITMYLEDDAGDPKDLTDYTASMKIRETLDGPVIKALATGSGITITAGEGKIVLAMTDTETAALGIKGGVYDLLLIDGSGIISKLLKGKVEVDPLVTR